MTASIINLVDTTAKSATPDTAQIPGVVQVLFTPLHYVHRLWRWYRKAEIYSNPENFVGLLGGHLLNFFAGDSVVLRVAAQCVFIATRILECIQQKIVICHAYKKLKEACQGTFAYHPPCQWIKETNISLSESLVSASTLNWIRLTAKTLSGRIQRIALCILRLLKEIFILSMRVMDAIESFSLSPTTRNDSLNELFVNGTRSLDILVENKQSLLSGLKDNKEVISSILQGLNPQYNVNDLIAGVSKTMKVVETVHSGVKAINSFCGGAVVKAFNHGTYHFLCGVGLSEFAPSSLDVTPDTSFEEHMADPRPLSSKEKIVLRAAQKRTTWPVSAKTKSLKKGKCS